MILKYLIRKEFTQIRRNAFLPRLIILFPIAVMCVMPWVMNMEVKNVKVEVVDYDRSTRSQRLVHRLEASHYFLFQGQKVTYREALEDIEHSRADMVMVIPRNFEKRHERVLIAANAVNGTKGAMGSAYLSQIIMTEVSAEHLLEGILPQQIPVPSFSTLLLYNKYQNFKFFMIPALFAIVMMLMTGFLPTLNIVAEKEAGTIEQINVTPVSKWSFILAKLIPYWIISLLVITTCLLLAWLIYDVTSAGPLWLIYVLVLLLALFFSSFGLIISNYSDTMQQAIFVMWFFVIIMLLLSGLFTPSRSMPFLAYATTYINPMSYFIEAVRTVFIRGGHLQSIWHQMLVLLGISLFMGGWAVKSYKKNSRIS